MRKQLLFILMLTAIGCVSKKHIKSSSELGLNTEKINVVISTSIQDSTIQFSIVNISKQSVFVYNPMQLHIERNNNGVWEKLRLLNCPCGAPCVKPLEFVELPISKERTYTWNKEESWCGSRTMTGIPETIISKAATGLYRITIIYSTDQKEKRVINKEFNV